MSVRVGWFLAVRAVRHNSRWTTGLIVFVMFLTFLNLVVVSGLLSGLIVGSFDEFRRSYSGEVMISVAPRQERIRGSIALLGILQTHPAVQAFSPRLVTSGTVLGTLNTLPRSGEEPNRVGAEVVGIDVVAEESVTSLSRFIVAGEMLEPGEEGVAVVGSSLLAQYSSFAGANIPGLSLLDDVDVGSRIRITFTTGGRTAQRDFFVKGIVDGKVGQVKGRIYIRDLELRRVLQDPRGEYQEIAISVVPGYEQTLVAQLRDSLGDPTAANVQTSDDAIPTTLRDINTTFTVMGNALSSIALVVASITVFIVIFINALTRRKHIGIMKGIGIPPSVILCSYLFQALFYGVVGSVLGVAATYGAIKPFFDAYPIDMPFSDGILVATPSGTAIRAAILLAVTLVAGYVPARIIVRKNTLDSILGR